MSETAKAARSPNRYFSYEEYLQQFYGSAVSPKNFLDQLESSFGVKAAKRILEIEAIENRRKPEYSPK
jgi:hypothetical protein